MSRFSVFLVLIVFLFLIFAPLINAQDDKKLTDEEKEKLRQELIRIQRQIRTDYQRLAERMQKTQDSIKSLTDPIDKANFDRLQRAITLMKDLKIEVDMDDLEIRIQNKSYFAAMQLAKEITEKLKKIIDTLDEGSQFQQDERIKKVEEALQKLADIKREQKAIEEKTEQTFKHSEAREYQEMMRKVEELIEKQKNLRSETQTLNSRLDETENSIKQLEALKKAQSELNSATNKLKEGKNLKEEQRLSMLEELLKELVELIRDQSTQITEITNIAELKQHVSQLNLILNSQTELKKSLNNAETNNQTLKTFNDIKEIESIIKMIFSIRSAEEGSEENKLAVKLLEPQKKLKTLIAQVTKDLSTLVQSNPNNTELKASLTFIQDSEQDIDQTIELLTIGDTEDSLIHQEKTRDAIAAVVKKMQNILKSNVPEIPLYAKNQENLTISLTDLLAGFNQLINKNTEASTKNEIEKNIKSVKSAMISMQAAIAQLNNYSSRQAIKDVSLCITAIKDSLNGFNKLFASDPIVKFLNLKASEQHALIKRLEMIIKKLATIEVAGNTDEEKQMLQTSYEASDILVKNLKDSTNPKVKEYREELKQLVDKAKGLSDKPSELEKTLQNIAKLADNLAKELLIEATPDSNELARISMAFRNLIQSTAEFVNTRENANKALSAANLDMSKAQEFLNLLKPLEAKGKQIDAVENLKIAKNYLEKELEKSLNKKAFNDLSEKQKDLEKKTDETAKQLDKLAQKNASKNAEAAAKNTRESSKSMNKASENLKEQKSSNAQTSQKQAEKNLNKAIEDMKKEKKDLEDMLNKKSKELSEKQDKLQKNLDELQKQLDKNSNSEKDEEKKKMVEKAQESGNKASQNMGQSKKSLQEGKPSESEAKQEKAVENLEKMKDDLKKLAEKSLNAEEKLRYEKLQQEQKELKEKTKKLKEDLKEDSPKAEDELNKAQEKMRESEQNLGNQQGSSAQQKQKEAQEHLDKAEKELEKLLREYEKSQNDKLLLHVEQELEKMLKSQILINQKTNSIKLESEEAGRIDRKLARQLRQLADQQKSLASHAEELSDKLEKGRIPIFAYEMSKVSIDMKDVSDELKTKNVDEFVIEIQEDILRRLKDMLAAIRAERKRRQEDPQPPQQGGGGQPRPRLVPIPAELELLLLRQEYIRAKHEQFMKRFPNLKSREEMTRSQRRIYERLSAQQGHVAEQLDKLNKALFKEGN